jgi:hypothetical protein
MWEEAGMAAARFEQVEGRAGPEIGMPAETRPSSRQPGIETQTIEVGVETHWVLNEHRRKDGIAVMPGTGYIELARTAFAGGPNWIPLEMRDVLFLAPMVVEPTDRRALRLEIDRDDAVTRFSFASRPLSSREEGQEWELHASGAISAIDPVEHRSCDLDAIIKRCPDRAQLREREPAHEFWTFGPRWASLKEIRFGELEALLVLEIPPEFEAELSDYPLHPALLDMATGELVTQFDECTALFVPFSYASIRAYRPLERLLHCHVRYRQPSFDDSPVAAFDVTIADDRGVVLAEVNEFLMRRVEGDGADFAGKPATPQHPSRLSGQRFAPGNTSLPELFEYGVDPARGIEALDRILCHGGPSQIIVSPVDLDRLLRANRATSAAAADRALIAVEDRASRIGSALSDSDGGDVTGFIVSLWQEALGVEDIGTGDDFFALGGHSLSLVQAAAQLRRRFNLELALSDLIERSTVEEWARTVQVALDGDGKLTSE